MLDELNLPVDYGGTHSFVPINAQHHGGRIKAQLRLRLQAAKHGRSAPRSGVGTGPDDLKSNCAYLREHHMKRVASLICAITGRARRHRAEIRNISATSGTSP